MKNFLCNLTVSRTVVSLISMKEELKRYCNYSSDKDVLLFNWNWNEFHLSGLEL